MTPILSKDELSQALKDKKWHIDRADYDSMVQRIIASHEALRATLEKYTHCRHGCIDCFCTKEARATLKEK